MTRDKEGSTGQVIMERVKFLLIVFAAAWGVYTFVYKETYLPAKLPVALSVSSTLEEVGRKGSMAGVRISIRATNNSQSRVWVPALWYTVVGVRVRGENLSDSAYASLVESVMSQQGYGRSSRHFAVDTVRVIATGRFVGGEKKNWLWYEPGQETINEELFFVPTDRYDAIFCGVTAFLAKDLDDLALVGWGVDEYGSVEPELFLKRDGFANDSSLTEPFDPANPTHSNWEADSDIGRTYSVSTLSLWPPSR